MRILHPAIAGAPAMAGILLLLFFGYCRRMPNYTTSPFHRFQGWRLLALFAVFLAYTLWYIGPGFFGQMSSIPGYSSLQEMGFYSGAVAVETLGSLGASGQKLKYLALIFDVPYMILQALVFEGFIAFGIRNMRLKNPKWNLLFILPIAFLLTDFAEDSFIALTLATGSQALGAIAGLMTAAKFLTFIPGIIAALIFLIGGITGFIKHR
jgi:hypothetical protein